MSGANYQRLSAVNGLHTDWYGAENHTSRVKKNIEECETALKSFCDSTEVSGSLDTAIRQWVTDFSTRLQQRKTEFEANTAQEKAARAAMAAARTSFGELMTDEMIEQEFRLWNSSDTVVINGLTVKGTAYAQQLRAQRIAEREIEAQSILDNMNSTVTACKDSVGWGRGLNPNAPTTGTDDSYAGSRSTGFQSAASNGATVSSAAANTARLAGASLGGAVLSTQAMTSIPRGAAVNWARPEYGAIGSATNPITDPSRISHIDLLHTPINQRMSPDGPVGGHIPAPTADIDDPAWRRYSHYLSTHIAPGGAQNAASAGLVGGILGSGGSALALRGLSGGPGSNVLSGGGSGFSPLGAGSLSGSGMVPRVSSSGVLSARGVNSAASGLRPTGVGAAGMQGSLVPSARGAAAGASAAGRGGARGATTAGRGAVGSSAGGRSDDKKRRRGRSGIGYDVVRVDEDESTPIDASRFAAGSALDLAPLEQEESDQW